MTRDAGRRTLVVAAATLAGCLIAGCSGSDPEATPTHGKSSNTPTTAAAAPSETPPTSPSASASGPPRPGELRTPASTSGTLSRRSFPRPGTLGGGWSYAVDPGDAEEGYLGNGTPALERDPAEVVTAAVPFGCDRPAAMPTPRHVLEVDYRADGVKVIALRGAFRSEDRARKFFDARTTNLEQCRGRSGGQAIGPLVTLADTLSNGVMRSDRTPESDPWTELALLDGDQVVLVAAQNRPDRPPLARDRVERLVRAFRT